MKKFLRLLAAPLFVATAMVASLSLPASADAVDTDPAIAAQWQTAWDTYKFAEVTPPPPPGSGRSRTTTSISVTINESAKNVFDAYSNINNHIGRAAFLKRVVTHKQFTDCDVRYINFTAIEDVPFEGTVVSLATHAQQRLHRDDLFYETDTWSEPNVVTHQKITFARLSGGKTKVTERLTFEADTSLIDFVVTNGVASHQQTQTALKQAIESGAL
ncbi:hypothetical protein GCM10023194_70840 [Planotetraspora phitsanulokensis]|uniref:Uncharacterized protein n=1 Tax=Planotetraspora phitsanulokensis TaxID=575192 RepID=A0A8J3XNV1_9ACTN|nr:hypothetical protein [Planotetraspora phitsanulokensis]GII43233.1 hypothetical protein Pph01_82360 [Planotetraspora phitsanulokensis]